MDKCKLISELREHVQTQRALKKVIGCVPTMGALHRGHLSLVEAAKKQSDFVIVTIFVNPTQFAPNEDLSKYPRPLEKDLELCESVGADLVFCPDVETVYPSGKSTVVSVPEVTENLEGEHRPGHFDGVSTIVLKLFNMVQPDIAFFGAKDFQQQLLIRKMCNDLNVPTEIVTCPTVREDDGLAMSSRNVYLNPTERKNATALYRALQHAQEQIHSGNEDLLEVRKSMMQILTSTEGVLVEYATIADANTLQELESPVEQMVALIAARLGSTRLIDNLPIQLSK